MVNEVNASIKSIDNGYILSGGTTAPTGENRTFHSYYADIAAINAALLVERDWDPLA